VCCELWDLCPVELCAVRANREVEGAQKMQDEGKKSCMWIVVFSSSSILAILNSLWDETV
jgi:hypothetical protein